MGRPKSGILGSFAPEVKGAIGRLRPGNGGWGAITIKVELELDPRLSAFRVPSVRSINRLLKSTHKPAPIGRKKNCRKTPWSSQGTRTMCGKWTAKATRKCPAWAR